MSKIINKHIVILLSVFLCLFVDSVEAQEVGVKADDGWALDVEAQASLSNASTPLWLNANKYGMSSLSSQNGYVRGVMAFDHKFKSSKSSNGSRVLDVNAGLDVIVPIGYVSHGYQQDYTSHLIIQQAFAELNYKLGTLVIGAKHQPMELKNNELSSGSQTLGINARPVPQVRIGLNDYWDIPFTKKWLGVKAHMAFGVMTDGAWEEAFASGSNFKYNKNSRYHQKAGYLRIGKEEVFPLTLTLGLEMAAQFGGTVYNWGGTDMSSEKGTVELSSSLKSYWHAFTGTGGDTGETMFKNAEGNSLGSWMARLNYKAETWEVGAYIDHYFEDNSGLFLLGNDGYGTGSDWDKMTKMRFFQYDLQDMLVGADMKLKNFRYLNQAVVEYMNTRYQSGPVYHDHNQTNSEAICGRDNYYNHSSLPGWQHWGQVIGNPLYLSPLYNSDGQIAVECNRFYAWHFGIAGDPIEGLHYRMKVSYQKGYGMYDNPYIYPKENTSILVEAGYAFPETSLFRRFTVTGAYGADFGALRGNNSGVQFTVKYRVK